MQGQIRLVAAPSEIFCAILLPSVNFTCPVVKSNIFQRSWNLSLLPNVTIGDLERPGRHLAVSRVQTSQFIAKRKLYLSGSKQKYFSAILNCISIAKHQLCLSCCEKKYFSAILNSISIVKRQLCLSCCKQKYFSAILKSISIAKRHHGGSRETW